MILFFQKRWFLISLAVLIAGGLILGMKAPASVLESTAGRFAPALKTALAQLPRVSTAVVLFLMAFSLDTHQLRASFRSPLPVLWASSVNYGFIPLLAWPLMWVQQVPDFSIGLMIAASVPCTLAAASVWTRKAGGNDAVSLMTTLLTNALCFALTPFWLQTTTGSRVTLDPWEMAVQLLAVVLVPTVVGQFLRQFRRPGAFAVKHKAPMGVLAQSLILVIVFLASCKAGSAWQAGSELASHRTTGPTAAGVGLVWGTTIGLHLAAMWVGVTAARWFGFRRGDRIAVAFAGSQKTLPIGVLLATDPTMFGNPDLLAPGVGVPFAVFPMLMYHATQLFIDTAVADRFAGRAITAEAEEAEPPT